MGVGNRVMWLVPPLGGSSWRRLWIKGLTSEALYWNSLK